MSEKKRTLNLTLRSLMVDWMDLIVEQRGYSSRSVLVEELIRERYDELRKSGTLVDDLPAGEFAKMVQRAKELAKEGGADLGKSSSSTSAYPPHQSALNEARETPAVAPAKKKRAA